MLKSDLDWQHEHNLTCFFFWIVRGNQTIWRKLTQSQREHTNSTQKGQNPDMNRDHQALTPKPSSMSKLKMYFKNQR